VKCGGHCRREHPQPDDGIHPVEKYPAGINRAPCIARSRHSVPATFQETFRQTGFGSSAIPRRDTRTWLLLARAQVPLFSAPIKQAGILEDKN